MQNKNEILQELKEISPFLVPQQGKKINYSFSSDYFDTLPEKIINRIHLDISATSNFTTLNPYSVPRDYFTKLTEAIIEKVSVTEYKEEVEKELETIAPLLNSMEKTTVYTTPGGYFQEMNWNELMKGNSVIKPASRVKKLTFIRYAAAAIIIGILVLSALLLNVKDKDESTTAHAVQNLSEQEIINFLKTTSPADNVVSSSINGNPNTLDKNIKTSVSEMSDMEIQQFLRENGEQVEM